RAPARRRGTSVGRAALQARTIRGGRSGPSVTYAAGTRVTKGANRWGTSSVPNEIGGAGAAALRQHDAQALHLCAAASAEAGRSGTVSATAACACGCVPAWRLGGRAGAGGGAV